MNNDIIIFTDGSSSGNPGPGGWATIVSQVNGNTDEYGGHEEHTTNNRMELKAVYEALKNIETQQGNITIHTDSKYVIQGCTLWIKGWVRNNWITSTKTDVINRDLWEKIAACLQNRSTKGSVTWKHIAGHSGVPGNERCDEIATSFTFKKPVSLFSGNSKDYTIDLSITLRETSQTGDKSKIKKSSSKNKSAYSYVSFVDGKISTYKTWTECEAQVKGKRGAKFKKSFSPEDEKKIITDWTS